MGCNRRINRNYADVCCDGGKDRSSMDRRNRRTIWSSGRFTASLSVRTQSVKAFERVRLGGLTIIEKTRVEYSSVNQSTP